MWATNWSRYDISLQAKKKNSTGASEKADTHIRTHALPHTVLIAEEIEEEEEEKEQEEEEEKISYPWN